MVLNFGIGLGGDLFSASAAAGEGFEAEVLTQIIWKDVGIGIVPIGAIVAWAKDLDAGIPPLLPNFVECNGQVLSDGDSPLNGVTIPDLNAVALQGKFLKGAAASGVASETTTHTHSCLPNSMSDTNSGATAGARANTFTSGGGGNAPPNYTVVWVMRIK